MKRTPWLYLKNSKLVPEYTLKSGEVFVCARKLRGLFHIPEKCTRLCLRVSQREFEESVQVAVRLHNFNAWVMWATEPDKFFLALYDAFDEWALKNFQLGKYVQSFWVGVEYED